MALSREVLAIIEYVKNSGVAHRVTSTYRPGSVTSAGYLSYHSKQGTGGGGLAADLAEPSYSSNSPGLLAIFNAFRPVEHKLAELIYSGASYNIKNGQRVARYAVADHWDHVHVAVPLGTFLVSSAPIPPYPTVWFDAEDMIMQLPVLRKGSTGNHVRVVQALMILHAGDLFDESGIDGIFGDKTESGIKTWQGRTGTLAADGVVGPATWRYMLGV